jgi:hypothetical membrane protein
MDKTKVFAGITGIFATVVFFGSVIASAVTFKDGIYSPASCFVTELGLYTKGDMISAPLFNAGLIAAGLALCVFMIKYTIKKERGIFIAAGFFGVLSGVFLSAQGIFCLNYSYHGFVLCAFLVSVFITYVLLIIAWMLYERKLPGFIYSFTAFLAGAATILYGWFNISGGMAEIFREDSMGVGRLAFIPFALIGWAAYALFFLLIALLASNTLLESRAGIKSTAKDVRDIDV